jgi:hypothetical protein
MESLIHSVTSVFSVRNCIRDFGTYTDCAFDEVLTENTEGHGIKCGWKKIELCFVGERNYIGL